MNRDLKEQAQFWITKGAKVFPIAIEHHGDKWQKRPLTRHGHKDATDNLDAFEWNTANGFGITMGSGLYALDVDTYKTAAAAKQWMHQNAVPVDTRAHKTISGGAHLIYRTNAKYLDLRSRQNVVTGLDTRGAGGWIAWGAGYELQNPRDPVYLPLRVCKALHAGADAQAMQVHLEKLDEILDPPLKLKIYKALQMSPALRARWRGDTTGLTDASRSAMDLSLAQLLGMVGFSYSEIHATLMRHFDHGQARHKIKGGDRAAHRCAARATAAREDRERVTRAMLNQMAALTPEQEKAMRKAVKKQGRQQ